MLGKSHALIIEEHYLYGAKNKYHKKKHASSQQR
jgi:hypothetical protein